jgi:hypothetical protein
LGRQEPSLLSGRDDRQWLPLNSSNQTCSPSCSRPVLRMPSRRATDVDAAVAVRDHRLHVAYAVRQQVVDHGSCSVCRESSLLLLGPYQPCDFRRHLAATTARPSPARTRRRGPGRGRSSCARHRRHCQDRRPDARTSAVSSDSEGGDLRCADGPARGRGWPWRPGAPRSGAGTGTTAGWQHP